MPLPSQIVECIANVSEGRDTAVLQACEDAIEKVEGCALLHRDVGASAHRTVFTFAGMPDAVFEAAFALYKVAVERIDMRMHHGEHPRIGAVDVCPFVPIKGIEMPEIVAQTQVLGKRLGEELGVPVFLYEASATAPHRRNLADIRRGEYEDLPSKTSHAEWQPDYGPRYNDRFGATVLGARPFLIAWNINLSPGTSVAIAKAAARRLRASGYRGEPGLFPGLKAIGWHLEEMGRSQISCNIVDADNTNLARVYLTAVNLVTELGGTVTGSELIGLIPGKYLMQAGKSFSFGRDPADAMEAAVAVLGLSDLAPFDPKKRILEKCLEALLDR